MYNCRPPSGINYFQYKNNFQKIEKNKKTILPN